METDMEAELQAGLKTGMERSAAIFAGEESYVKKIFGKALGKPLDV